MLIAAVISWGRVQVSDCTLQLGCLQAHYYSMALNNWTLESVMLLFGFGVVLFVCFHFGFFLSSNRWSIELLCRLTTAVV